MLVSCSHFLTLLLLLLQVLGVPCEPVHQGIDKAKADFESCNIHDGSAIMHNFVVLTKYNHIY